MSNTLKIAFVAFIFPTSMNYPVMLIQLSFCWSSKMNYKTIRKETEMVQGWAIPGFDQLYYTNTILVEKLTVL